MAKTAVEFNTPKLSEPMINLVPEKLPELKLPKFDLEALFSVQTANLAAANEVQTKPEAVMADVKAAAEKAITVAKEVVDLTVAAQKRVAELVTQRVQASVTELKALTV